MRNIPIFKTHTYGPFINYYTLVHDIVFSPLLIVSKYCKFYTKLYISIQIVM